MHPRDEARFGGDSAVTVLLVAIILFGAVATCAYRFTLPTDGWLFRTGPDALRATDFVFDENWLGAPSPIQPGDRLLSVEGRDLRELPRSAIERQVGPPDQWQAGHEVTYLVERGGQELKLTVPLYWWDLSALLRRALTVENAILTLPPLLILAFVFKRRPSSRAAQLLLLYGAFLVGAVLILDLPSPGGGFRVGWPEVWYPAAFSALYFYKNVAWLAIVFPLLGHLSFVFPTIKKPMRDHRRLVLSALYGPPALLVLLFVGAPSLYTVFGVGAWRTPFIWPLILAAINPIHTLLTARDPVAQAQVRWVALGLLGTVLGYVLFAALGPGTINVVLAGAHGLFQGSALPVCVGVAILRYRLFAIDLIINRALVYGSVTAILAGTFAGLSVATQRVLLGLTGESSQVAVIVAAITVTALFQPLRRRVQVLVDRHLHPASIGKLRDGRATGSAADDDAALALGLDADTLAALRSEAQNQDVATTALVQSWIRERLRSGSE